MRMARLIGEMISEIAEKILPRRKTRSNPRGVKRKMTGYKKRSRATQKAKARTYKPFQIVINTN